MVGLIGAMPVEMERMIACLEEKQEHRFGMDTFYSGRLYGVEAVLAVCGPGKVNAALCAQSMIFHFNPEWVLNLGTAGAGDNQQMGVGDMVIATGAWQHDMDTTGLGDPPCYVSKIGVIEFPCDQALREKLVAAAAQVPGLKVYQGPVATGDQFVNTQELKQKIRNLVRGVQAVEMEGAAVAHACYVNGTPCGIVRSISDGADGNSDMDYATFVGIAAEHSQQVVENLLKGMK